MKTELDTIREALEKLSALKGSWDGERYSLEESDVWSLSRPALAVLSTIDQDAQRDVKELRDLFDLQHTRTMEADKLWQKAHGTDCLPDLGELIEWLMKRSDPDAIRRECDTSVQGTLTKCGVHLNAGIRKAISAAILGAEPARDLRGEDIKRTYDHDEGAYARCSYCGRYSDDPKSLQHKLVCDCGKETGWCGSFMKPTKDSVWNTDTEPAREES